MHFYYPTEYVLDWFCSIVSAMVGYTAVRKEIVIGCDLDWPAHALANLDHVLPLRTVPSLIFLFLLEYHSSVVISIVDGALCGLNVERC